VVAEYHCAELESLLVRVAEAVDRYREGELDAFDVDQVPSSTPDGNAVLREGGDRDGSQGDLCVPFCRR
jgi:hypothetical protein